MKSKKDLRSVLAFLVALVVSISFTSCDGGSSEEKKNDFVQNLMNHKWIGSSTDYDVYSYGAATFTQTWTVYFTSEHEGVLHIRTVDKDSSLGTSRWEEHLDFSYTIDGNTIRLYGDTNFVFTYHGDFLMEGDDMFQSYDLTSSDYSYLQDHKLGYHGKDGEIDAKMIFETSLEGTAAHNTDYYKEYYKEAYGWYSYRIKYRIGVTEDAFKKGVTKMRITAWSNNASYASFNTADFGKEYIMTIDIVEPYWTYTDELLMCSKDRSFTLNYKVEYYNSNDSWWYIYRTGSLSFSM